MEKIKNEFNFKSSMKKFALLSLSASLLFPIISEPLTVNAFDPSNIQVKVHESPQVDIALTFGVTNVSDRSLEDDILKELEKRGINPNKVNFISYNTTTVSTNDAGAEKIFSTWENYPNDVGKWQLTTIDGVPVIRSTQNTQWTGFWYEDDAKHVEIKSELAVTTSGDDDWVGIAFRMNRYGPGHPKNPYKGKIDAYDMYAFAIDGGGSGESALFKMTKVPFENNRVGEHNMWNPNHNTGNGSRSAYYTQEGSSLPVQHIGNIPNSKDVKGKIVSLQRTNTKGLKWKRNEFQTIEIKAIGNLIQVWVDGKKEIEYLDEDDPILSGGYGPYAASQSHATHRNMSITRKDRKSFLEVLMSPEWRENAEKFIVNFDDEINPSFEDPQESGEINMRMINEGIDFIAIGSDENKGQSEKVIKQINGEGTFINSKSNYNTIIRQIADYVESNIERKSLDGNEYVIVGKDLGVEIVPENYKRNTQNAKYPNGRWRIEHDENYFHNSLGRYAKSGLYQKDFDYKFELPGRYELWFENVHPKPRYIYAHREPVANFLLDIKQNGSNYQVNIEDYSYDSDLVYQVDKGIAEKEWKWRKTTSDTWSTSEIPSTFPKGESYIVQLRVKDHQGAWSKPMSRYFTTDSVTTKPIASFEIPNRAFVSDDIKIHDTSYDPSGKKIVDREWILLKNGIELYKGKNPIMNFEQYGEGEYKVQLRVKNETGQWSERFERTIKILPDLVAEIKVTGTPTDWTNENVQLNVETKNITKLLMPDGTFVTSPTTTFTATENGKYTFIGYNVKNEVVEIATYVVDNIDKGGKKVIVIPDDDRWRNKDVEVRIEPIDEK